MKRFFLLPALAAVGLFSGCAVFEPSLTANTEVASRQTFEKPSDIIKAAKGDISKAVTKLRTETRSVPMIGPDGALMLDGNGNAVFQSMTLSEFGLPLAPTLTTFEAGGEFVKSKVATSIHNNPDGAALDFNAAASPDAATFEAGTINQALRTEVQTQELSTAIQAGFATVDSLGQAKYAVEQALGMEETKQLGLKLEHERLLAEHHGGEEGIAEPETPEVPATGAGGGE